MVVISEVPEDEPKAAAEPTPATLKAQGNQLFASGDYEGAVTCYLEAVELSGTTERQEQQNKEIAVFKANVAACYMKTGRYADAVQFCTEALEVDGGYVKALVRRAQAREKQQPANDKGLEVLTLIHDDYKKAAELEPSNTVAVKGAKEYGVLVEAEREKQKAEMFGKLKDLGNMVLGKFGMSVDNFKFEKDPNTGSYSVNFVQGGQQQAQGGQAHQASEAVEEEEEEDS